MSYASNVKKTYLAYLQEIANKSLNSLLTEQAEDESGDDAMTDLSSADVDLGGGELDTADTGDGVDAGIGDTEDSLDDTTGDDSSVDGIDDGDLGDDAGGEMDFDSGGGFGGGGGFSGGGGGGFGGGLDSDGGDSSETSDGDEGGDADTAAEPEVPKTPIEQVTTAIENALGSDPQDPQAVLNSTKAVLQNAYADFKVAKQEVMPKVLSMVTSESDPAKQHALIDLYKRLGMFFAS